MCVCFCHHCWESDASGLGKGLKKKKKLISYLIETRLMSLPSFMAECGSTVLHAAGFACDEWFFPKG